MRTAIILTGNLRTWEQCKSSFIEMFDDSYDVFITTYDKVYNYPPFIKEWSSYEDDVIVDCHDVHNMFDGINVKKVIVENDEYVKIICQEEEKKFNQEANWQGSTHEVRQYYPQFRKIKSAFESIKKYEEENGFNYDRIIKTRFDVLYNKQELDIETKQVLVDEGNLFPNDWFFLAERDIFENIINDIVSEFYEAKFMQEGGLPVAPPHGLLLNAIKRSGADHIARFRILRCVLRKTPEGVKEHYY
mgnify:FL=1